jgi:molybdate/tungstate transport system substrate-binding protein
VAAVGIGVMSLVGVACGSSSSSSSSTTSGTGTAATTAGAGSTGTVSVLSAGSLLDLMEKAVGPGFHSATGGTVNNFSAGSTDLASDIKGKVKQGDVFISASPKADKSLMGSANGGWVSWYSTFATSKLVLGYNPRSTFAADLKSMPWYDVVTKSGFKLGFTPPATDPKGVLAVEALDQTAKAKSLPALTRLGTETKMQFPETSLEVEVESGQLDAGFFYQAEADSAGIVTVPLTGVDLAAAYTITVLKGAPDPTGATAFVKYLLGSAGQADLNKYGFIVSSPPKLVGTGVPAALTGLVGS